MPSSSSSHKNPRNKPDPDGEREGVKNLVGRGEQGGGSTSSPGEDNETPFLLRAPVATPCETGENPPSTNVPVAVALPEYKDQVRGHDDATRRTRQQPAANAITTSRVRDGTDSPLHVALDQALPPSNNDSAADTNRQPTASSPSSNRQPSDTRKHLIWGAVVLVLGIVAAVTVIVVLNGGGSGDATTEAAVDAETSVPMSIQATPSPSLGPRSTPLPTGVPELETKLTSSNIGILDNFGSSVAISDTTLVVGAERHDDSSGSAYVFELKAGVWSQQAELVASDGMAGDNFGFAVDISGSNIVVTALSDDTVGAGSAFVFVREGTGWTEQAKLKGNSSNPGNRFGQTVAIDGNKVVVGADRDSEAGDLSGSAFVFVRSDVGWTQQGKLIASDAATGDYFGFSVDISDDRIVVGASQTDSATAADSGAAYIFSYVETVWTEQSKLSAPDGDALHYFGSQVSISGNSFTATSVGDRSGGGSLHVFLRNGETWTHQAKLTQSGSAENEFGRSLEIDGDTLVAGTSGDVSGSVYVFLRSGSDWSQQAILKASDAMTVNEFAFSAGVSGNLVAVGAHRDDESGGGSVYVYDLNQY